jgi:hypothetical protein
MRLSDSKSKTRSERRESPVRPISTAAELSRRLRHLAPTAGFLLSILALGTLGGACLGQIVVPPRPAPVAVVPDAGSIPFVADPPSVYVAKVKNVLVGLAPTPDEVKAVETDPTALRGLVGRWMQLPEYQTKMRRFFQLAFQQTQITQANFNDQGFPGVGFAPNAALLPLLLQNIQESFARTVLMLQDQGKPITEAMATQQFAVTTGLLEFYGFLDTWQVDDKETPLDEVVVDYPNQNVYVEASAGQIPIEQSVDPHSPNYMHWYHPGVGKGPGSCTVDPIVIVPKQGATNTGPILHNLMAGALPAYKVDGGTCNGAAGTLATSLLQPSDYSDWRLVTIRTPQASETPTRFWNLPLLRTTTEVVFKVPRVGFLTPAFFANWSTNSSNQMRVTMNQAFIVATGAQIDGNDPTLPPVTPGLDAEHAADSACAACHRLLDPSRAILSATYSWYYHSQTDPGLQADAGLFAFRGVVQPVQSVGDLARALATHPLVSEAWTEKLCVYVNSAPCEKTDPEFQRVVGVFKSSNHSWNALVEELVSSPITTHAAPTLTAQLGGDVIALSRRDHLCAALNARLGFEDVCGLDAFRAVSLPASMSRFIGEVVPGLPSDGYSRGAALPNLPIKPSLFYRAGTEDICEAIAPLVIDTPAAQQVSGVKQWSSAQPDAAIAEFVSLMMGIVPSDERYAPAVAALRAHFDAAKTQPMATASLALQSTFVTACLAPSLTSLGM